MNLVQLVSFNSNIIVLYIEMGLDLKAFGSNQSLLTENMISGILVSSTGLFWTPVL